MPVLDPARMDCITARCVYSLEVRRAIEWPILRIELAKREKILIESNDRT